MKSGIIRTLALLLTITLTITLGYSKNKKSTTEKYDSLVVLPRIMIAQVEFGDKASEIGESKVEAAMNLAVKMSQKFILIGFPERDSVINAMKADNRKTTAGSIAKELNADRIYFIRINVLENMLRADISSSNLKNGKKSKAGVGYCLINFREKDTEKRVYDPSLLKALQRAFADVEKDTLMFDNAEGPFKVYPAPTLVIGGIDFRNTDNLPEWKLYDKKTSTSFDGTEVIFETARTSSKYVAYDMASRDSIYAMFNMHIVENYRPPTSHEMDALSKLDVNYYITGFMNRVPEGAKLELYLCAIKNKSLDMIGQEAGIITKDDTDEMRKVIKEITKKLLKLD